jgi:hypothetical protein
MHSDVVVFQRNVLHPSIFDAITYFQGMGKPVVIDLDDAYQMLPWSNPARKFWHEQDFGTPTGEVIQGGAMKMLEEGMRLSNGILSPNRILIQDWLYAAGNGYYLQNYAEPRWWLGIPDHNTPHQSTPWRRYDDETVTAFLPRPVLKEKRGLAPDRIVVGWGGSISHYDSFWGSGVFKAAERVSTRHPELFWLICGNDDRIYQQLPVSPYQKGLQGGVPPHVWPQIVSEFDIGIAPLYGPYDQRRSWIKGIEYSLAGIPWIATEGEPYGDIAGWPTGIQGPEIPDFWEQALEETIKGLQDKTTEAESLVGEARSRFIVDNQLHTFKDCFDQIISDFQGKAEGLPGMMYVEVKKPEEVAYAQV